MQETAAAKANFLATMSHEMRTPLNVIIGISEILKKDPSQASTLASRLNTASECLLHIINDVLDYSKIQAGSLEADYQLFNIHTCAESLVDFFSATAKEKKIDLNLKIKKDVNQIFLGDEVRVRQILMNLLSNAIKFTEKGRIKLTLKKTIRNSKDFLSLFVSDTGIGIPKNKTNTIFEKFSQVDASNRRKFGGTGLGLSICKELAQLMNGVIRLQSKENEGSVFELLLPFFYYLRLINLL